MSSKIVEARIWVQKGDFPLLLNFPLRTTIPDGRTFNPDQAVGIVVNR